MLLQHAAHTRCMPPRFGREGGREGGRDGWMDGGREGGRERAVAAHTHGMQLALPVCNWHVTGM